MSSEYFTQVTHSNIAYFVFELQLAVASLLREEIFKV
jgi:hypothetical protein